MAKKGKRDKRKKDAAARADAPLSATPAAAGAAVATPEAVHEATAKPRTSVATPAAPMGRALANAVIVAFLAYQVAMPLRYYLGGGGADERFSWRMFSTLRMQRCRVKVVETVDGKEHRLEVLKEVQIAWRGMLERYRRPVVDKLLERRCEKAEASKVVFTRACTDTDGSVLPDDVVSLDCKSGAFLAAARAAGDAEGDAP
jgi:hypothetical protein